MSHRDIDRLQMVRDVIRGEMSQVSAAEELKLSDRQVRRMCERVREEGPKGILHRLKGRPSNNRFSDEFLSMVVGAIHNPFWEGFQPKFATEKLDGWYGIKLSDWTVRKLMVQTGLWERRRRRRPHRRRRERRRCLGMLVQLDGSTHNWFEGRRPECVLLVYIDDATSQILHAEFVETEDTRNLMRTTKTYLRRWGRPGEFYVDKDSIYNVNRPATVAEELEGKGPLTQFTRAMNQLGIRVIPANSPQAKGRVERGFRTHQDRLIKELRLAGISTIKDANRFLQETYVPEHNARYAVSPAEPADAHRPLLEGQDLDAILALWIPRVVQNDYTVQYRNRTFQILDGQTVRVHPKDRIIVQERLDGSILLHHRQTYLKAEELPCRPYQPLAHPKVRSVRSWEPTDLLKVPLPPPPTPNAFRDLAIHPIAVLRDKARMDAVLERS